jgi:hypothetical protein
MGDTDATGPAMRAAVAVAAANGLACEHPELVADGSNVLVHLTPAPVLARVATTTGAVRPDGGRAALERDVALAGWLAGRGAAVVPPSDELPPGPHEHGGLWMTFWTHVRVEADGPPAAAEVGAALRELHDAMRDYDGDLPRLNTLAEVPGVLDRLSASGAIAREDEQRLRAALADAAPRLVGDDRPLHGDGHRNNLLRSPDGLLWTDFEDTCSGPLAWDLACVSWRDPEYGAAALAAYGDAPALEPFVRARALQVTVWLLVFARRFPERRERYESRFRRLRDAYA